MIEWQDLHLAMRGFDKPLFAEAKTRTPETGHRIEVAFSCRVEDVGALAALNYERPGPLVRPRVGIGVKLIGHISGLLRTGQHGRRHIIGSELDRDSIMWGSAGPFPASLGLAIVVVDDLFKGIRLCLCLTTGWRRRTVWK